MRVDVTETDTLRVNSLLKRMRHHLEYRYTGTPQLKVLNFLATFKEAMDVNRVCEGLAALLKIPMVQPAPVGRPEFLKPLQRRRKSAQQRCAFPRTNRVDIL